MTEQARWFPPLDPPPGGRARLVAALAADDDRDLSLGQATFAALALVAMALVPFATRALRPDPVASAIVHAEPVPGRDGALALPARNGVQVYLVVATPDTDTL